MTPSGLDGLKYGLVLALVVLRRISWLSHGCVALLSCIAETQQYVLQLQAGYTPTVQEASHPSKSSADPQSRSELLSSGNRSMKTLIKLCWYKIVANHHFTLASAQFYLTGELSEMTG